MLFEVHQEGKIAYKRLSDADLRRSPKSHQTHIGLSIDSLTFMPDDKTEYSAMLIYKNYCDIINCEIAKILRKSGRRDAPKISTGNFADNVVSKIRAFAHEAPNKDFYLFWLGLESETPLFLLVEQDSSDFIFLNSYCDLNNLKDRKIKILEKDNHAFGTIINYLRSKIEVVSIDLQKDLEITAEMDESNPKFKAADVKKAKKHIAEIGREGEELVYQYLERQKELNLVNSFEWINKNGEQGQPYDFIIDYADGLHQWMDVKTTVYAFEQPIIISNNEVHFVADGELNDNYSIFRVYSKEELKAKLRICSKCFAYIKKMVRDIDYMSFSMADYNAKLINYKIQFEPTQKAFKYISEEIVLPVS